MRNDVLKPSEADKDALSTWASELADAMARAVSEVRRAYGATTEDMAWELIWMGAEYFQFTGVTRARAVELLLERAEDAIADILYETYYAQDEGKPAATLGEIDKMRRQAVTEFYDQARHLVQPRLAGSRWPTHHRGMQ